MSRIGTRIGLAEYRKQTWDKIFGQQGLLREVRLCLRQRLENQRDGRGARRTAFQRRLNFPGSLVEQRSRQQGLGLGGGRGYKKSKKERQNASKKQKPDSSADRFECCFVERHGNRLTLRFLNCANVYGPHEFSR